MYKHVGVFFLAAIAGAIGLAISDHASRQGELGLSSAQAIVSRPLTSVPVSGVAQRTAVVQCASTMGHGFC
jgi:hypothetical protein